MTFSHSQGRDDENGMHTTQRENGFTICFTVTLQRVAFHDSIIDSISFHRPFFHVSFAEIAIFSHVCDKSLKSIYLCVRVCMCANVCASAKCLYGVCVCM